MSDKVLNDLNQNMNNKQRLDASDSIQNQKSEKCKSTNSTGIENLYRHKKNIYDQIRHNNPFLN